MPYTELLQPLVGDEIAQVCLDPHGVQFVFDSMRRLVAEHDIEHIEPDGVAHAYDCVASQGAPLVLHRLLYRPIVAIEREELSFTLRFDDGAALRIHTELGPYECGQLYMSKSDADIIVF